MTDLLKQWQTFLGSKQSLKTVKSINLQVIQNKPNSWFCDLAHWEILRVEGEDAASFLQGQVSCDIMSLDSSVAKLSASINLKGRIISNFIILKEDANNFLLICPEKTLSTTQALLKKYAVFSKVTIEHDNSLILAVGSDVNEHFLDDVEKYTLNTSNLNCVLYCLSFEKMKRLWQSTFENQQVISSIFFNYQLIEAGIVFIQAETSERFTPQEINFELVGGISITKGCYTGQEVVARLHYRGIPKRRAYIANCAYTGQNSINLTSEIKDTYDKSQGHVLQQIKVDGKMFLLISLNIQSYQTFKKNPVENVLYLSNSKNTLQQIAEIQSISEPPYSLSPEK